MFRPSLLPPESNDSSSPNNLLLLKSLTLLWGEIDHIQKEKVRKLSDPVAERRACAISHIFPNNNLEDSFKMGDEDLNFIPNKELDKEDLIPIPRESKIRKECDFPLCDDFQVSRSLSNPFFAKKDDFSL
ncbi:hypothetical protein Tco_0243294 [Tanacetum coccineum]